MNRVRTCGISVFLIILLGTGLRFMQLGQEGLWLDELATAYRINLSWSDMISHLVELKYHPPLHYAVLKIWSDLFGHSEFALRSLSAVSGVFAMLIFYKTGVLLISKKATLAALLFLALSKYQVHYAQEARFYSLMGLFALLSMYFFIRLWKTPSWKYYLGYILSSSASLYNHSYGLFLIAAQNAFFIAMFLLSDNTERKQAKQWCISQVILALTVLPWAFVFVGAVNKIQQFPTALTRPTLHQIWTTFVAYAGDNKLAGFILLSMSGYFLWTLLERFRHPDDDVSRYTWTVTCKKEALWNTALLSFWLVVPIMIPYLISKHSAPIYGPRYLHASYYPFILMSAEGLCRFRRIIPRVVLGVVIIGFSVAALVNYYSGVRNHQWREAVNYIESNAKSGDCLFFVPWYYGNLGYGYYGNRADLPIKSAQYSPGMAQTDIQALVEETESGVLKDLQGCSRLWFAAPHTQHPPHGPLLEGLRNEHHEIHHQRFHGVDVYVFESLGEKVLPGHINPSDG